MDRDYFSNFLFPCPRWLHLKCEQYWPRGFRKEVVWNSQHFSHINVWGPYTCRGKQTWPRPKKVKCPCTTISLVDLPSPMICAKIQPQNILGLEKIFNSHLKFSIFSPIQMYGTHTNAYGSKLDLAVKKVKPQRTTIIFAILVDLLSLMICAKIRPQGLFGSGEEDF